MKKALKWEQLGWYLVFNDSYDQDRAYSIQFDSSVHSIDGILRQYPEGYSKWMAIRLLEEWGM